jgi:DNA invertase Pin-like site-specific DNA recombinase
MTCAYIPRTTAGVKFGRKPKLSKRKGRELLDMLESVVASKKELAQQFNVSRATIYRLSARLDKEFKNGYRKSGIIEAAPRWMQPSIYSPLLRPFQAEC